MRSPDNIYTWLAILLAAGAILKNIMDFFKSKKRDNDEIEEALNKAPLVREELELGNVGAAVKHLNVIMESQAKHIQAQDKQIRDQNLEIRELKKETRVLKAENHELTKTNENQELEIQKLRLEVESLRNEIKH